MLSCFVSQEERIYLKNVKYGLNQMLNIIREEIEESVVVAWRDLEGERDQLRHDLQVCRGQVASQADMPKTASDETSMLHHELTKVHRSHALLSGENGRLASNLSKSIEKLETVRKELKESRKEHQEFRS